MGSFLPITSQLVPVRRNLPYLVAVAAVTRMFTGAARVIEERPSQQKDPQLTTNQKRQAMGERFFVEIIGSMLYMVFLHLGQDLFSALPWGKAAIPKLSENITKELDDSLKKLNLDVKKLNGLIEEVYNPNALKGKPSGLIYRVLYENATLANLHKKISEKNAGKDVTAEFKNMLSHFQDLEKFARHNNLRAAAAILTGVVASAAIGGPVIQWLNDRAVAPMLKKWLGENYKDGVASADKAVSVQPAQNPVMPLRLLSAAPGLEMNSGVAATPVYLPNPKVQPAAMAAFAGKPLPKPYSTAPLSSFGGRS